MDLKFNVKGIELERLDNENPPSCSQNIIKVNILFNFSSDWNNLHRYVYFESHRERNKIYKFKLDETNKVTVPFEVLHNTYFFKVWLVGFNPLGQPEEQVVISSKVYRVQLDRTGYVEDMDSTYPKKTTAYIVKSDVLTYLESDSPLVSLTRVDTGYKLNMNITAEDVYIDIPSNVTGGQDE